MSLFPLHQEHLFIILVSTAIFINPFFFQKHMAQDEIIEDLSMTNEFGSVTFLCPKCGKYEIKRTKNERQIVRKYTCPGCGFTGPN